MTFTLLPAVDVADGRAVRPVQSEVGVGIADCDALEAASAFQHEGAEWVHLVDLDAAFGRGSNHQLLLQLIEHLDLRVELSGGIGSDATLTQAMSMGCTRAVLATSALADLAWCYRAIEAHSEQIAIALDVRVVAHHDGSVHHRLTSRGANCDVGELWETLSLLDRAGCCRYIVTDVSKDGMMRGPNVDLYRSVTRATSAAVIASGGVSSIRDLVVLNELATLEGAIVGTALYSGGFTLADALATMREIDASQTRARED